MAGSMSQLARRVSDQTATPKPQPAAGRDRASELLALQRAAGNQAVALLMGGGVVQRHPGPTTNDEVGGGSGGEAPIGEAGSPATAEAAGGSAAEGAVEAAAPAPGPVEGAGPTAGPVEGAGPADAGATSQPGTGTTGTGTTGTTGGALTGDARRKAIEDTCRASNTGTWAMSIIDKWKIPVDYEYTGQGSFHQGGKIYINKTLAVGGAAITLMHEAQHADTYKSGKQADRTKLGRDEYIKQSIADEAEAVVRQIEGLAVTASLGVDMEGAVIDDALKQRYLTAFYAKRDELRKSNPEMSTADINAICRTTARDGEVTKWFHDGTFVTSTNNNTYAIFYGNQWDEVNKAPGT